jgi:multicomponent Na+:H+ antiporter subunit G
MTEIFAHWREWLVLGLLIAGALFLLLAAVGVVRLPDVYTRMQAATKAATLGAGCTLFAVAVYFDDFGVTVRALLVVAFIFLTAPVAAHMIGRAAYNIGVPFWRGTNLDEMGVREVDGRRAARGEAGGAAADERAGETI